MRRERLKKWTSAVMNRLRCGNSSRKQLIEEELNKTAQEPDNVSMTGSLTHSYLEARNSVNGFVNEVVDPKPDPSYRDDVVSLLDMFIDTQFDDETEQQPEPYWSNPCGIPCF